MKQNLQFIFTLTALIGIIAAIAVITAPGYKFGDVSRFTAREIIALEQARSDYCDQTKNSKLRHAALLFIKLNVPVLPANGIC